MGLIRNVNESWMDVAPDNPRGTFDPKRTFRLNDPEAHIRRLSSFGAGIGVNLTSTHPVFSHKSMWIAPDGGPFGSPGEPRNTLDFDEHDEGLIHTVGHLRESLGTIVNQNRGRHIPPEVSLNAVAHLTGTRVPFQHNATIIPDITGRYPNEIAGLTSKLMTTDAGDVQPHKQHWDGYADDTGQDSNFRKKVSEFRERMRGQVVSPGKEAIEVANNAINNPTRDQAFRVANPEKFSSQFVKIVTPTDQDVIDLHTGTWAKIGPDEYFPH